MLNHARMRDRIAARTGYRKDVVAHILDQLSLEIEEELLQQGEVVLRGLFRIVPGIRTYYRKEKNNLPGLLNAAQLGGPVFRKVLVRRIFLSIRPVRSLRRKLSEVPLPGLACEHNPGDIVEKNAVVLDDTVDKIASNAGRPCPSCGSAKVNYAGLTPNCPNCGSRPWEPKERPNGPSQSRR